MTPFDQPHITESIGIIQWINLTYNYSFRAFPSPRKNNLIESLSSLYLIILSLQFKIKYYRIQKINSINHIRLQPLILNWN